MAIKGSRPPPTKGKGDKPVQRVWYRPHIQVPTLPPQPEKPTQSLQSQVNDAKNQVNRGGGHVMENVPASPQQTVQLRDNTALRNELKAYQQTEKAPMKEVSPAAPTRADSTPAVPQSATAGQQRLRSLGGSPPRPPYPPVRAAQHGATTSQHNIAEQKTARDEQSKTGQSQAKEKEKTSDKNRDKGKDHER